MKKYFVLSTLAIIVFSCNKKEKTNQPQTKAVEHNQVSLDAAKTIAGATKKLLVTNLTQKIADGGTIEAISFCNLEAIPLTKSVSDQHGIEIKRVSDRNRNPNNLANEKEMEIIEQYKSQILKKEELKPQISGDYYYEPLVTNAMCLQCHGVPNKNIKPEVTEKLAQLYPNDQAIGYGENEIRGLIRVKVK